MQKNASQSSTSADYIAANAVDLDTGGVLSGGTCAQTAAGADQWWAVDLDRVYLVSSVRIHNRADCCG